jgi:geranyl-CoA carboxylase beta subunit
MPALVSSIIADTAAFKANRTAHLALIDQFRGLERKVREMSGRAEPKFRERNQLLPRDRIKLVLDRGTPFVELSTLCGLGMHDDDGVENILGGGNISGIGFVAGVRCLISAADSGIKGGALQPSGIDKTIRAQTIALENKLPFVQLVESAGGNLLQQAEIFVKAGGVFANLARLSAAGIPVISVVHGSSTAGGAYQVGLGDYVVMVRGRSKVFLAGPPLLKAATGEIAEDETLGGARLHTAVTGVGDYLTDDDADALRIAREIINKIPWDRATQGSKAGRPPRYDPEELLGIVPVDYRKPYDVREVIARVVDDSDFLEFKANYGAFTICGHAELDGKPIGIIGNNGPIDSDGATKVTHFIQLCCQSGTPLVFLQNTTGFMVGVAAEGSGIVKHGSKMIQAVTNATVPKVTIQIGASFGAGHYAMCGRAFGPRFLFSWPNNRIAMMGGEQAAKVLAIVSEEGARARGREPDYEKIAAVSANVVAAYDQQSAALYATGRLWDDGLIDPRDTRRILSFCVSTCLEGDRRSLNPNIFGVARV